MRAVWLPWWLCACEVVVADDATAANQGFVVIFYFGGWGDQAFCLFCGVCVRCYF